MRQVHSRPSGKITRSPGPKLTESEPSVTVTLPVSIRQVSFSVYSHLKVLGPHFQIGQVLQLAASASEGFLTMISLTVGILFSLVSLSFLSSISIIMAGKKRKRKVTEDTGFFRQDNRICKDCAEAGS